MSDNLDRIKDRIRALRQMTQANGCTEAEALAAAERVMALMQRHGLSEADLARDQATQPTTARRRGVADNLWPVVAQVCRCRGWLQGGGDQRLVFSYYGAPADVAVALYLHELLLGAIRRESQAFRRRPEYTRRRKAGTRAQSLRAFQHGLVVRLMCRLHEVWWLRLNAGGDGRAVKLAEQAWRDALSTELAGKGLRLASMQRLDGPKRGYNDAAAAGWAQGCQVAIDPGVNAGRPVGLLDAGSR